MQYSVNRKLQSLVIYKFKEGPEAMLFNEWLTSLHLDIVPRHQSESVLVFSTFVLTDLYTYPIMFIYLKFNLILEEGHLFLISSKYSTYYVLHA